MRETKKTLFSYICLLVILLFSSANTFHKTDDDDRYNNILHTVGYILKSGHYSPQVVNDTFSEKVFNAFIKDLDPEKMFFLEKDIEALKKYYHAIDEEILGSPVDFFFKTNQIYKQRLAFIKDSYLASLEKPFQFQEKDSIIVDYEQRSYAANEKVQIKMWAKKLKYMTLGRLIDLQDQRQKSKVDSIKNKSDLQLETSARNFTKTAMGKTFDKYLRKTTDDNHYSLFINAITNAMDPHTDYFMPVEKRSWDENLTGKFYGIGALIGEENGYVKIATVTQGGPAWKTGEVNDGDLILKIAQANEEPIDVAGYDIPEAIKLIRGNKGSTVTITFKKTDGTIKVVPIVREELKIDETFAKSAIIDEGNQKTGYLYLPKFYTSFGTENGRSCYLDVANELKKLQEEKVDGIILDLRNNGGGSLQEVVNMVGLFIPDGPVVQVKDGSGKTSYLSDNDQGKVLYDGPLVVMVNEFSASASEIFAAAIQDYKRGVIVGSNSTFGKGTVQRPIPLNRNMPELGSIHLTIQKYYRVNGASTQLKGVEPDLLMPGYYDYFKVKEKDNISALVWDETANLKVKTWVNQPDYESLKKSFQKRNDSTQVFYKIQENSKWIAKQNNAPDYLNITNYVDHEKIVKEKATQTKEMFKLAKEMKIKLLEEEQASKDSIAINRNTRFINFIKKDFYLKEASSIVLDMNESTSKTKSSLNNIIEKKEN
jgi:carboxyl-terminal processing protease